MRSFREFKRMSSHDATIRTTASPSDERATYRSVLLSALVVLSVVAGGVALGGGIATAATDVSISPDDNDAGATGVTYTADGTVDVSDTLQHVDVHLSPANVSGVGTDDVRLFIDGNEYSDGISQFDASDGAVEFKLANSRRVSDGDSVRVEVGGVSNPDDDFNASVTLHDTGDDRWQRYDDSVAIDASADVRYSDLAFDSDGDTGNETTLNRGENLSVSATVENTDEQAGTYNASLVVDGTAVQWENGTLDGGDSTSVSFVTAFDSTGEYSVTVDELSAGQVTVTGETRISDGDANPNPVTAGTTVDNQKIHVQVDNVSQDGDTDWHYVEFPNELDGNISLNGASANATSITSSVNLVEGFDDDGIDDTARFATSGDGGGDIALNLTLDATVGYPDGEAGYPIDVRVADSDGGVAQRSGVVTVQSERAADPNVTDYAVRNPSGRDVRIAFDADERLSDIGVELTEDGNTVAILTERDFSESGTEGARSYQAEYTVDSDGEYTATLTEAADADGNDGEAGQSGSVTVSVPAVAITGGSASPDAVTAGETVNNQRIHVDVADVSADGDTDWHYVEFPNELAGSLSVNSADAAGTAVTSSANLVDGFDDDGVDDTVRFATSADGGGSIDTTVTVDVAISAYPAGNATYAVDARVVDSIAGTATQSGVASVTASEPADGDADAEADPEITDFRLVASDEDVDLVITTNVQVSGLAAEVSNAVEADLKRSDFTEAESGGDYVYTADVASGEPGVYRASAESVSADGSSGEAGQTDRLTLLYGDEWDATVMASPPWPDNDSAHTFVAPVTANSSIDGDRLRGVEAGYSDAFLDDGGSISSVSDDQNVATLLVVDANGTVKSRLGGTDAVTVNVASDAVHVDLSGVDSARAPQVEGGDRVVVRLRPVTNPETPDIYATQLTLEGADEHTDEILTGVRVRNRSSVGSLGTDVVAPNGTAASGAESVSPIEWVDIDPDESAVGPVRVTVPDERPGVAERLSSPVVRTLRVRGPSVVASGSVELDVSFGLEAFDGDPSALELLRYDEAEDTWTPLETNATRENDSVSVVATTEETSLFAVTAANTTDERQRTTAAPTTTSETDSTSDTDASTGTDTPTGTDTSAGTDASPTTTTDHDGAGLPVGGLSVGVLSLGLAAAGAAAFRQLW